jgi:hypothetical protein
MRGQPGFFHGDSRLGVVSLLKEEHENLRLEYFQTTATASCHMFIAAARKARCVLAEMRSRWMLKML